jgi:MFS family permease
MLLFPRLVRRFGLGRLIVAGAAITLLRQLCNVCFTDPSVLLFCSLLQGVGYALLFVGGITFVSRNAPSGAAATAQGLLAAVSVAFASVLGAGLEGQLAGLLTIRGAYLASSVAGLVGTIMISLVVLRTPTAGREPRLEPSVLDAFVPIESAAGFEGEPEAQAG